MAIEDILKPEFIWFRELTDSEKKVIKDSGEYPIFEVINGIPDKEIITEIYKSMRVKDEFQSMYNHTQEGWVAFFKKCFCEHHCIDISELENSNSLISEEINEYLNSALPEKFKLYYSVKHRNEMLFTRFSENREIFFFNVDYRLRKNN
ncbi:MAG: hypothetical protein M1416_00295 [Candidatus Pacearchaeota archaeon]|nr:hypothetical protein [Candidatus Pacearchaeota archaeon]